MDDQEYLRNRIEKENVAAENASCDQARLVHHRLSNLYEQRLTQLTGHRIGRLPPRF